MVGGDLLSVPVASRARGHCPRGAREQSIHECAAVVWRGSSWPCPDDGSCSLHLAETQEQRQTQVTSHEFAEITTDPELNAWFGSNGENGDICNGETDTITVGANTWTVQRTYSKTDDINTGGASFWAANPIPPVQ